jgi:hypothetical protein
MPVLGDLGNADSFNCVHAGYGFSFLQNTHAHVHVFHNDSFANFTYG